MDNHGFRYYDPEVGRYISPDPLGLLEGLNHYLYVDNNPINHIDPQGLFLGWLKAKASAVAERAVRTFDRALDAAASFSEGMANKLTGGAVGMANRAISDAVGQRGIDYRVDPTAKKIGEYAGTGVDLALTVATPAGLVKQGLKKIAQEGLEQGLKSAATACAQNMAKDYVKDQVVNAAIDQGAHLATETGMISQEGARAIIDTSRTAINMAGGLRRGSIDPEKCFVAGTLVSTPKGLVAIERIKVGDQVYAFDVELGEKQVGKVVRIFERKTDTLVEVCIGDVTIQTTDEHPFYIVGVGWVEAKELVAGDTVLLESGGKERITSVTLRRETATVYNFEVAGLHNYFVSTLAVLVHNNCSTNKELQPRGPDGKWVKGDGTPPGIGAERATWDAIREKKGQKGWTVTEGRVHVTDSTGQVRVYDGVAHSPSGRNIGLEVKSGTARRTAAQREFDGRVNSGADTAIGIGDNNRGLRIDRVVQIRRPAE